MAQYAWTQVSAEVRKELAALRKRIVDGNLTAEALSTSAIAEKVQSNLVLRSRSRMLSVFNLTGTVLHTNFGRALLPDSAVQAVARALATPVNLEFDLMSGGRGDRDDVIEPLLCELTGAEAATIVNNNAAAVLLVLNTLANRREVVVSRGELVEIGGAFRIPDVMRSAGAKLMEVGTTNRTYPSDYTGAIGPRTALLMKIHTSNYAISGYTANVGLDELSAIGRERALPVAVDLGSGSLIELKRWRLPKESTVRQALVAGADLVMFSGDKLLGGPQAGIIVGRKALIRRLKKNPLKRALRVGKLTIAALESVLALYRAPELLADRLTTLRSLTRGVVDIEAQAQRVLPCVQNALSSFYSTSVQAMESQIGSGALPIDCLPSCGLIIRKLPGKTASIMGLEAALRKLPRPIIGRKVHKALCLDMRCLEIVEEAEFVLQWDALRDALPIPLTTSDS
jgi:L-seryl-tRNA(Ser) seleniumtransferase